ncbi:MAG TPA: cation:proton antiporter [Acidimicrobiia bacterium]|nr:cation:proton antiporter [Acidimicrobiia bacterium]
MGGLAFSSVLAAGGLSFTSLLAVAAIALAAPLLVSLAPRLRMPAVVLEIVIGIIVGPSGLGWVRVDVPVNVLAIIGLSFLLFLAGLELNLMALRGRVGRLLGAYGVSAVLALGGGAVVAMMDAENKPLFIAIVLASTSLGLVVPVLRDAGQTFTSYGQLVLAAGSIGEFGAILALAVFYSQSGAGLGSQLFLLIGFAVLVVGVAVGLTSIERSPRFAHALAAQGETSAQLGVRVAILVLSVFVALSTQLGFEAVLGAFVAGALLRVTDPEERLTNEHLRSKLDAIGYGFLVPAFFVTSGLQFDLNALFREPTALLAVPLLVALFFVVRCLPAVLYRGVVGARRALAAGLLQATSLSVPVVAVRIGTQLHTIDSDTGAAIIAAGLLTVVIFPPLALMLISRDSDADDDSSDHRGGPDGSADTH